MPVLYVEPPVKLGWLRRRGLFSREIWTGFRRKAVRTIHPNLHILQNPNYLAISGSPLLANLTWSRWLKAIRRSADSLGIDRPILWVSLPEQYDAVGRLNETLSIYHVVDEYSGYTSSDEERKERRKRVEQRLLDSVDILIVISPELKESKSGPNREIHLVENAVELQPFEAAHERGKDPKDLARIRKPRLGYSGLIGKRLDLDLINGVAKARCDWSVVFIGKVDSRDCEAKIHELQKLPNVHFLGEKHPDQVPDYIVGFNVGLLPYAINLETTHISPLKMYEYFAAGLPVVSTAIPASVRKKNIVAIATGLAEFEKSCDTVLRENTENFVRLRIDEARSNTWDHRIKQISELIHSRLEEPNA